MFLYDKTNILEGSGIFEVDFAPSHGPASLLMNKNPNVVIILTVDCGPVQKCRYTH